MFRDGSAASMLYVPATDNMTTQSVRKEATGLIWHWTQSNWSPESPGTTDTDQTVEVAGYYCLLATSTAQVTAPISSPTSVYSRTIPDPGVVRDLVAEKALLAAMREVGNQPMLYEDSSMNSRQNIAEPYPQTVSEEP
jgi:hypothetical protein